MSYRNIVRTLMPARWLLALMYLLPGTTVVAAEATSNITVADLTTRIAAVEAAGNLDASQKARAVANYRGAIANLDQTTEHREKARHYAELVTTLPAELEKLRLESLAAATGPAVEPVVTDHNLADIEQQLLARQSELLSLNNQIAEIEATSRAEQQLDLAALLSDARRQLAERESHASNPPTTAAPLVTESEKTLALTALAADRARVDMLSQQQLSRELRVAQWDLQQRSLSRQIDEVAVRVASLQSALSTARTNQADEAVTKARERALAIEAATGPERELAEETTRLAADIARVGARTESLLEQQNSARYELRRLERYHSSITQQLAVTGADRLAELGAELLAQRRQLTQSRYSNFAAESLDEETARAQLMQLRIEDRMQFADEARDTAPGSELTGQLQTERAALLDEALTVYRRYITALNATREQNRSLALKVAEYRELLDSRLFWIPSTSPVSIRFLTNLGSEVQMMFSPERWRERLVLIQENWPRKLFTAALLLILGASVFVLRYRLADALTRQAAHVGNVSADRMRHTWISLAITLLLAAPGPLLLCAIAVLLRDGGGIAERIVQAVTAAASLWFLLEAFRQTCRPAGLAEKHFKWSSGSLKTVTRNLPWFTRVMVPVTMISVLAEDAGEGVSYDALSRLAFVVASLALAYFGLRTLRPNSDLSRSLESAESRWLDLVRYFFYPLGVLLPLLLLLLSLAGYHFTALQIESMLFVTACLLIGLLLVYFLLMRAVSVIERRMQLERLRAKRKSAKEQSSSRQAADIAAEGVPDTLDLPEYDLDAMNSQTRAILRMSVILVGAFALWQTWSDVLPALLVFQEFELWRIASDEAGAPVRIVTLGTLLIAAALGFLSYFGMRNVPGLLEMSILRRIELAPGTSYAITTIVKYCIVLFGVLVVLGTIGVQWSKLQWLVAAMGVGLGFGLQEIVANFVSGLLILFERPIRVGDTITVNNHTGTVSRIRIRATTLTDWDRKEQIIPNKTFITEQLTNWTLSDPITRVIIKVGVAYGSDIEVVHKSLSEVVAANERVIEDPPPAIFFVGFGDSSLNFEIRVFINSMLNMMPLTHELHVAIERKLREKGIAIPFPQRDIWIRTEEAAAPGPA